MCPILRRVRVQIWDRLELAAYVDARKYDGAAKSFAAIQSFVTQPKC